MFAVVADSWTPLRPFMPHTLMIETIITTLYSIVYRVDRHTNQGGFLVLLLIVFAALLYRLRMSMYVLLTLLYVSWQYGHTSVSTSCL